MQDESGRFEITLGMDSAQFKKERERFLSQLRGFPHPTAKDPRILGIEPGSAIVTVEVSDTFANAVVEAYEQGDPALYECLSGFPIRNIRKLDNIGQRSKDEDRMLAKLDDFGQRLKDNDVGVLDEIVKAYGPYVDYYLKNSGFTDERDREEYIADALLKLWETRHTFDSGKSSLRTWLYTIAKRCGIDAHRKHKNPEINFEDIEQLPSKDKAEMKGPSADAQKMKEAMSELSYEDQEILRIYARWNGKPGYAQEAAEHLGLSPEAVRARKKRAFEKIKKHFDS